MELVPFKFGGVEKILQPKRLFYVCHTISSVFPNLLFQCMWFVRVETELTDFAFHVGLCSFLVQKLLGIAWIPISNMLNLIICLEFKE